MLQTGLKAFIFYFGINVHLTICDLKSISEAAGPPYGQVMAISGPHCGLRWWSPKSKMLKIKLQSHLYEINFAMSLKVNKSDGEGVGKKVTKSGGGRGLFLV